MDRRGSSAYDPPRTREYTWLAKSACRILRGRHLRRLRTAVHVSGTRYHHLMDPDRAAPRRTPMHTVTVVADRCIAADAASTAVFGMKPAQAQPAVVDAIPGAYWHRKPDALDLRRKRC